MLVFVFLLAVKEAKGDTVREKNYRIWLSTTETLLGLGGYSWLIPLAILESASEEKENVEKVACCIGLWTPAMCMTGGYFAGYYEPVRSGTPLMCLFAGANGIVRGFLLNPDNAKNPYSLPLFLSVAENALAFKISNKLKLKPYHAIRFLNYNLLGYFHGWCLNTLGKSDNKGIYGFTSLIEGYFLSFLTLNQKGIITGDAIAEFEFMRVGATSPLFFIGGIDGLLEDEEIDSKYYALGGFLGSTVGFFIGNKFSQKGNINC